MIDEGGLKIGYEPESATAILEAGESLEVTAWERVKELTLAVEPDSESRGRTLFVAWPTLLNIAAELARLRTEFGFSIAYTDVARSLLQTYVAERRAIAALSAEHSPPAFNEDIDDRLSVLGFQRSDGKLRSHQKRNISKLTRIRNGADFSVPGAGKTTVALAVHMLSCTADTKLLVVSPKNAFAAWDTVLDECLTPEMRVNWFFTRLTGGVDSIAELLALRPRLAIISYDQLVRVVDNFYSYLAANPTHLILDESHRIKSGYRAHRGTALMSLSPLAVRRDILSGTPMPKSSEDLVAQFDFLWPGQGIGNKIRVSKNVSETIRPYFSRTTKQELGLKRPVYKFVPIRMSNAQLALYSLIRDEVLKRLKGIRSMAAVDFVQARRSIIRLMQVSSNPILMVRSVTSDLMTDFRHDNSAVRAIFEAIIEEHDSPKLLAVCQRTRELAASNHKVVVWTSFTENVERLSKLLADLNAVFIHGSVDAGSELDEDTREGRIRLFHDDPSVSVLVANPAACSEGISLHKVCHHAIYLDRTFNAAHYLQSVDRIHRLGLSPDQDTYVEIFESVTPALVGSIDFSVRRRTITKLRDMAVALEDADLRSLALDEEEADVPIDSDIGLADIEDIMDELQNNARPPGADEDV